MFQLHKLVLAPGPRILAGPLSLGLDPRQGLLLRGASGSGKSSLLRLMAGLARPRGGSITWQGLSLEGRLAEHRLIAHMVDQRPLLKGASLRESLCLGLSLRGLALPSEDQLQEGLRQLGLDLPLDQDPSRLSGGETLRAALLRGLLLPLDLLLLDEPTAGLDEAAANLVMSAVMAAGRPPVVVVSHEERWAEACAQRFELRQGALHEN